MKRDKSDRLVISDQGPSQPAPTVVFLHGFPFTRSMWRAQVETLISEIRVIDYDLRGFGENPCEDGITTIEDHADDLLALLGGIRRIKPVVLCGHSLGGYVALRALVRDPKRFAGLVLCGAQAKAATDHERLQWAARIRDVSKSGSRPFLNRYLDDCLARETRDNPAGEYDRVLEEARSLSAPALKGAMLAMMGRTDTLQQLETINPPLLLLAGAEDNLTSPDALLRMGLGITGSQFVRVPYASHAAPIDNPEFFTSALRRFINSDAVSSRMG